jgi:hypothetical protein
MPIGLLWRIGSIHDLRSVKIGSANCLGTVSFSPIGNQFEGGIRIVHRSKNPYHPFFHIPDSDMIESY